MDSMSFARSLSAIDLVWGFLGLYLAQYLAHKIYNIFIYPYYVSPLRHLPGPKVKPISSQCKE